MIIGIDFDNTIASYDELMHRLAVEWEWVAAGMPKSKKLIRDALRALPDGEIKWRRLQTQCYGPGMRDARPMDGLKDFLADRALSGTATEGEINFLKTLRFTGKRPTALYYYRELQSFRDPLHFRAV